MYHTCQISLWSSIKLIIHGTVCQLRDGLVWGSLMERESLEHSSVQSLILQCSASGRAVQRSKDRWKELSLQCVLSQHCCAVQIIAMMDQSSVHCALCLLELRDKVLTQFHVDGWRATKLKVLSFKILQYTQVTHYLEQVPLLHIKLYHFVLSSKLHRFCWFQKLVTMEELKEVFNPLMALIVGVNP